MYREKKWVGTLVAFAVMGCASASEMDDGQGGSVGLGDQGSGSTSTGDDDDEPTLSTSVSASTTFTTSSATMDSDTDPTDDATAGGGSSDDDSRDSGSSDDSTTGALHECEGFGAAGLLLWSTLDDADSVTAPAVGSGNGTTSTVPANDFVAAGSGSGLRLDAPGESASFPQLSDGIANIDFHRGTIDFCYQPSFDHIDSVQHELFGALTDDGSLRVRKAGGNNSNAFNVLAQNANGLVAELAVPSNAYVLSPGTWYRVTVSWDFTVAPGTPNIRAYLDGVELVPQSAPTGPATMPAPNADDEIRVGAWDPMGSASPDAVFDDFKVYDTSMVP